MIIGISLIVLTWVLFIDLGLPLFLGIIITVISGIWALFALLFFVYFFNLDMKLTSLIQPFFIKIYEKRKRNKQI